MAAGALRWSDAVALRGAGQEQPRGRLGSDAGTAAHTNPCAVQAPARDELSAASQRRNVPAERLGFECRIEVGSYAVFRQKMLKGARYVLKESQAFTPGLVPMACPGLQAWVPVPG